MKRILSLAIVLVMLFALAAPTMAADPTYKVTVHGHATGHTYEAYQIFAGDLDTSGTILSNIVWGSGVDGDALLSLLKNDTTNRFATYDALGNVVNPNVFSAVASAADVAKVLTGYSTGDKMVGIFAEAAEEHLTDTCTALAETAPGSKTYETEVVDGYYLIKDQDDSLDPEVKNDYYTSMILEVVGPAEATIKGNAPTVDKSVNNKQDGTFVKFVDSEIGDYDFFKIEGKLPSNFDDYKVYPYTFVDDMPVGVDFIEIVEANVIHGSGNVTGILDSKYSVHYCANPVHYTHDSGCYNAEGVRVCGTHTHTNACKDALGNLICGIEPHEQHGDACSAHVHTLNQGCYNTGNIVCELKEHEHSLTECYDATGNLTCTIPAHKHIDVCYELTCTETNLAHDHDADCTSSCDYKLVIEFPDVKTAIDAGTRFGDTIMCKYKVRVNEHVTLGSTGNKNEVTLIYANDPTSFGPTGKTPPAISTIFSFGMDVDKVDAANKATNLSGAKFVLYTRIADERPNAKPNTYFFEYMRFDDQGKFTGLTYRTENAYPETADGLTIWEAVKANAANRPERLDALAECEFEAKNDDDGIATFELKGLDAQVYSLLEVKAPDGYNLPKNAFVVTIEPVYEGAELKKLNYEVDGVDFEDLHAPGTAVNPVITNSKGDTLPSTGGIGTTIFYALGGVLAVVAVVLLITKKRMTSEE